MIDQVMLITKMTVLAHTASPGPKEIMMIMTIIMMIMIISLIVVLAIIQI